jgi:hypothetical protein
MELPRISGSDALATTVSAALESGPASHTLLVFDFDRTLTNGISRPGDETETAKVVRGGEATVAALRRAHDAGARLYVITARRPVRLSVEQLFASMDNAQSALSPFFPRGDCVEFQFGSEQSSVPLARGGSVYASGYEKAAALAHIVSEQKQEGLRVFFFDDSVVNSYVVGTSTAQHLAESGLASAVAELRSYWWDSYEEEIGFSPTMELSSLESTDSNYWDYLQHMLLAYGVTSSEREARIAAYHAAGHLGHGLQRGQKERGAGAELASVEAASKASRAKMIGLAETIGQRFARGPRRFPPAPGDARAPAEGALLLSKSRRPLPPPPTGPSSVVMGGWQAKAAAQKARAAAAAALFEGRSAASLPPGPLSAPRWETAFQVGRPAEGTTGGLAFIATLAGAFAVKAAGDVAEEFFGAGFLQAAGAPVPGARVVFPADAEYASILGAVEAVAKQYSRRGDAEGAMAVMVHVLVNMRKYSGPLLLLELVPAALTLDEIGSAETALLLEPPAFVAESRARARLEAMGRIWIVDAALYFRDRFASRLSCAGYDVATARAKGHSPSVTREAAPDAAAAVASQEQVRVRTVGNLSNVLLTNSPLDGTALVAAGVAAVDSHVKLVRGAASDAVARAEARAEVQARLCTELGALLAEAREATESGTLAVAPSQSLGWLRFTVEAASGHSLSDGALAAARLGALHAVAAVPGAVAWARSELAAARSSDVEDAKWREAFARIDEEALVEVGQIFEGLLAEHADLVRKLPPTLAVVSSSGGAGGGAAAAEPALLAESELIGAEPRLWAALSSELRKVLLDERVRGVPAGPHSMEWPGWDADDEGALTQPHQSKYLAIP